MSPSKKRTSTETFGPYTDEYEIEGVDGETYIREVPATREVMTAFGVFAVPANHVLSFQDTPDGSAAVLTPVKDPATVVTRKKPGPKGPRTEKAEKAEASEES